jgi:hypothetical protein
MASVYADPKLRSKRTYVAVSSFNNELYSYTTSMSPTTFVTTGSLGATTGATAANSPRGHFLRETGARLYPGANPGISTLMVGVYDADSGLRGYIDPNAPIFAVFNSDKPVEMVDGGDNNTDTAHKGAPVYTSGDVIAGGNISIGGTIKTTSAVADSPVGQVTANGTTAVSEATTAATASSVILLSLAGAPSGVTSSTAYIFARSAGSFQIKAAAGDVSTYNYIIVN